MFTNESIGLRSDPLVEYQIVRRGKCKPAMYQPKSQQTTILAPINVSWLNIPNTGKLKGNQSGSTLFSPRVIHQMQMPGQTSLVAPGLLPSFTAGQLMDMPGNADRGGLCSKVRTFGMHRTIDKEGPYREMLASNGLDGVETAISTHNSNFYQNETVSLTPGFPGTTLSDSVHYNRRYPVDGHTLTYEFRHQDAYLRGYTTDSNPPSADVWRDSSNNSNYQKARALAKSYKQVNEDIARGMTSKTEKIMSTASIDTAEEKRKLALKQLLIRPITQMKGEAWNDFEWMDFSTLHNFNDARTDFLRIIDLTKDKKMAGEIKEFLGSQMLPPMHVIQNHSSVSAKKLNHFHVFWNLMHQLPFAVRM